MRTRELALHQILRLGAARSIVTVFDFIEKEIIHLRMRYWLAGLIQQQVLFRDIGDIAGFRIVEYAINIKTDAAKWMFPMLDDLANTKFRRSY